jgi:hypothetical protein
MKRAALSVGIRAGAAILVLSQALIAHVSAIADGGGSARITKGENSPPPMQSAPMKSNGSGVVVRYRVDTHPLQVGKAIAVALTLDGITDPLGASLRLAVDGGLSLGTIAVTRNLPPGEPTSLTVEVVPAAEGTAYLHVFTTQYGATSATSIPVQVGKSADTLPYNGDVKQGPGGDKILPMPVK